MIFTTKVMRKIKIQNIIPVFWRNIILNAELIFSPAQHRSTSRIRRFSSLLKKLKNNYLYQELSTLPSPSRRGGGGEERGAEQFID